MAIDTLAYVKSLEAAGVERRAAEAHAEALTHHVFPDLATKDDIKAEFAAFRAELKEEFAAFRTEMNDRFAEVAKIEGDMNARFAGIEGRLANLPTATHLLFMQAGLILAIFVAAYGLLKLAGHAG
jgi:hypothetical protein